MKYGKIEIARMDFTRALVYYNLDEDRKMVLKCCQKLEELDLTIQGVMIFRRRALERIIRQEADNFLINLESPP